MKRKYLFVEQQQHNVSISIHYSLYIRRILRRIIVKHLPFGRRNQPAYILNTVIVERMAQRHIDIELRTKIWYLWMFLKLFLI